VYEKRFPSGSSHSIIEGKSMFQKKRLPLTRRAPCDGKNLLFCSDLVFFQRLSAQGPFSL